ncbi:MAG: hypothetical protein ACOX30_09745 [Dethiobacteria bacterium]|jgi:bifunctional pyridoxal-dependent enzyme with beta-cystathionase and maltose regulon repressor activities
MEDKRVKFERLAEKRVTEVLKRIRYLGNLANRSNYDYSDAHVNQFMQAIENELKILKNRFKEETIGTKDTFSFKF